MHYITAALPWCVRAASVSSPDTTRGPRYLVSSASSRGSSQPATICAVRSAALPCFRPMPCPLLLLASPSRLSAPRALGAVRPCPRVLCIPQILALGVTRRHRTRSIASPSLRLPPSLPLVFSLSLPPSQLRLAPDAHCRQPCANETASPSPLCPGRLRLGVPCLVPSQRRCRHAPATALGQSQLLACLRAPAPT